MGAGQNRIIRKIVFQAMWPAILGIAVGLGSAFGLTRLMASLLFQVGATDPATYMGVSALLLGTALLSCWIPARRASKIDPVVAFRNE